MTERSTLINILLLTILAGVFLTSGGLQCAVDCLTPGVGQQANAIRVADCHFVSTPQQAVEACLNKACHQSSPLYGSLGGPVFSGLQSQVQPLANAPQQPTPQSRAASNDLSPLPPLIAKLTATPPEIHTISQQQLSLRSTVLLN